MLRSKYLSSKKTQRKLVASLLQQVSKKHRGSVVEKIGPLVNKTRVTSQPIRCKAKLIINTLRSHAFKALKLFTLANSHNQLS